MNKPYYVTIKVKIDGKFYGNCRVVFAPTTQDAKAMVAPDADALVRTSTSYGHEAEVVSTQIKSVQSPPVLRAEVAQDREGHDPARSIFKVRLNEDVMGKWLENLINKGLKEYRSQTVEKIDQSPE